MGTYRDTGFVLRSREIRDSDRHYTIFTEYHGKIVVLAKGTRKGKSKMAPHMGSFGLVDLMIARGKIIDRLAGANISVSRREILSSLEKTALLQSFLLAVDSLTKRDLPEERIFHLIGDFQEVLVEAGEGNVPGRSLVFDAAVANLLDILGFGIELGVCVTCRKSLVPRGNALNIIRGGIECYECSDTMAMALSADTIKILRFMRVEPLSSMQYLHIAPKTRHEVGFMTDLLLTHHLESRFSALHYLRSVL